MLKKLITTATIIGALLCACISPITAQAASDAQVVVQVIVREFYHCPVIVTLTPQFDGGQERQYLISEEDNWFVSDYIKPGDYTTSLEFYPEGDPDTDYARWDLKYAVPYGPVTAKSGEKTYVTVIEGNTNFVEKYWFLCKYERPDGERIRGTVTDEEAEEYFQESINFSNADIPPSSKEYVDYVQAQGDRITEEDAPAANKPEEEVPSDFEPVKKEEKKGPGLILLIIPAVVLLGIFGLFMTKKARKE